LDAGFQRRLTRRQAAGLTEADARIALHPPAALSGHAAAEPDGRELLTPLLGDVLGRGRTARNMNSV